MEKDDLIKIEVAFATTQKQVIIPLEVKAGCTILDAILQSKIQAIFPEIDINALSVGIFGKSKQVTDVVKMNDRVEIYRPLLINPMDARRLRVNSAKK